MHCLGSADLEDLRTQPLLHLAAPMAEWLVVERHQHSEVGRSLVTVPERESRVLQRRAQR